MAERDFLTSRLRSLRRIAEVEGSPTAEGFRQALGHPWRLEFAGEEASHATRRHSGTTRQVDRLPAFGGDVSLHALDVVFEGRCH